MRSFTPDLSILGIPLSWWLTLPILVLGMYAVFRWRRFGEDSYTWNHQYFKLALVFSMAFCAVAFCSGQLLSQPWQYAALWTVILAATSLTLRFARGQNWTNTAILSAAIVGFGLGAVPLADTVRHALYRPTKWDTRDPLVGIPRSTFLPEFPAGWQEQPGRSPHTYKRGEEGSGVLQISLFPPPDAPVLTGADAEKELANALDSIPKDMDLGQRISLSHEDGATGPMAFADYPTDHHGPVRFWMILSEARIFASYTDGKSPVADREIAEAHLVLKAARFTHANSR